MLAVAQGLTEWLPVSSSGHRILVADLIGADVPIGFHLLTEVGTLLAVVVATRAELRAIAVSAARLDSWQGGWRGWSPEVRHAWLVALAVVPIAIVGLLAQDWIEDSFDSAALTAWGFVAGGLFLVSTFWARGRPGADVTPLRALLIGVGQVAALLPSISRSGMTIGTGVWTGLARTEAARFSFLLAIPTLFGAALLEWDELADVADLGFFVLAIGFAGSAVVGFLAIRLLLALVRRHGLLPFGLYSIGLGVALLLA